MWKSFRTRFRLRLHPLSSTFVRRRQRRRGRPRHLGSGDRRTQIRPAGSRDRFSVSFFEAQRPIPTFIAGIPAALSNSTPLPRDFRPAPGSYRGYPSRRHFSTPQSSTPEWLIFLLLYKRT